MLLGLFFLLALVPAGCARDSDSAQPGQPGDDLTSMTLPQALSSGKPTLAEFGSVTCVPCKEMRPILAEIAQSFEGRLNVVIVEVYQQKTITQWAKIMAIPTQIIYDDSGKEVTRHVGFWGKDQIIAELNKLGID